MNEQFIAKKVKISGADDKAFASEVVMVDDHKKETRLGLSIVTSKQEVTGNDGMTKVKGKTTIKNKENYTLLENSEEIDSNTVIPVPTFFTKIAGIIQERFEKVGIEIAPSVKEKKGVLELQREAVQVKKKVDEEEGSVVMKVFEELAKVS